MRLESGESVPIRGLEYNVRWPVVVSVSWSGRGGDVWPRAEGIRWVRGPVPLWRRIWFWATGRYEFDYEGWPE
jgi:hypothetical protein